jgi:hypothetical protein
LRRYHYRGNLYKRGEIYGVSRGLRDYLVQTGHFVDQLVNAPKIEPQPMAEPQPMEEPEGNDMSRASVTGHGKKTRSFGKTVEV